MELRASVVSSVALRPSTVYVLRVEAASRVWHVRRCFTDFCELRDKLLAAATATATTCSLMSVATEGRRRSGAIDSPASASSGSSSCGSASPARSAAHSHSPLPASQQEADTDGFAFLLHEFPTRRRFWSRSGKLVRRRASVLDTFLQQALQFARDVHARGQIAVYFSVKMHLEQFLETNKHPRMSVFDGMLECSSPEAASLPRPTLDQYPVASKASDNRHRAGDHKQSKWRCAADRWCSTNESDSGSESDAEIDRAIINQLDRRTKQFVAGSSSCAVQASSEDDVDEELLIVGLNRAGISRRPRPRPSSLHPIDTNNDRVDEYELRQSLRKAASAMMPRETREMRLHYTGSHYAPMQSGPDAVSSASAAWAARIEIAGIRPMVSTPALVHPQQQQFKSVERETSEQPMKLQLQLAQRPRGRHAARPPECA